MGGGKEEEESGEECEFPPAPDAASTTCVSVVIIFITAGDDGAEGGVEDGIDGLGGFVVVEPAIKSSPPSLPQFSRLEEFEFDFISVEGPYLLASIISLSFGLSVC